jgi:SAM-dependent methyltransferase
MLDVGVGAGRTTTYFAPLVAEYLGFEYSGRMVKAALARHPTRRIVQGDVRDLAWLPPGSQDFLLFSNCGLDGLNPEDRLKAFRALRRVAAPGALFAFATHNRSFLPVPKPWSLSWLTGATSMRNLVLRVALYPIAIANYLRLRAPDEEAEGCIVVNDAAEGLFNMRVAYVSATSQAEQLARSGWRVVEFLDMTGAPRSAAEIEASADVWFTVIAAPT